MTDKDIGGMARRQEDTYGLFLSYVYWQPTLPPGSRNWVEMTVSRCLALVATAFGVDVPLSQFIPAAFNQKLMTVMAVSAVALSVINISGIWVKKPVLTAISLALVRVSAGVLGLSSIFQSGWNAVK